MEILLSGLIVWSVWFFARYLRIGTTRELLACALFTALAAATKQQALVLLVPSIGVFLVIRAAGPARAICSSTPGVYLGLLAASRLTRGT